MDLKTTVFYMSSLLVNQVERFYEDTLALQINIHICILYVNISFIRSVEDLLHFLVTSVYWTKVLVDGNLYWL